MAKQIMSKLPEEMTMTTRPFQFVALDIFGPFNVKDMAGGRRQLNCADHGTQITAGAKELDWSKVTGQGGARKT